MLLYINIFALILFEWKKKRSRNIQKKNGDDEDIKWEQILLISQSYRNKRKYLEGIIRKQKEQETHRDQLPQMESPGSK